MAVMKPTCEDRTVEHLHISFNLSPLGHRTAATSTTGDHWSWRWGRNPHSGRRSNASKLAEEKCRRNPPRGLNALPLSRIVSMPHQSKQRSESFGKSGINFSLTRDIWINSILHPDRKYGSMSACERSLFMSIETLLR
ncbi:hypothetical protein CEXT_539641 [Caerostris extrusa]|uniref:Uncharacterized protein n=1 Tax=Caerostris extrusa TaxID=172846 RepID=A0AAV4TE76_CAEEX|nr:hypothetical protein CEXT_539641 [Caerostris extrusa]